MSDWGATPSWDFALKGLDQESGVQVDVMMWKAEPFVESLRKAYAEGNLPKECLSLSKIPSPFQYLHLASGIRFLITAN
jgi:hypothetical protein